MNWPAAIALAAGVGCALISIRIGQAGVERYGRRIPVTEMIAAGRQGDRQMLLGGVAGYAMAACFVIAALLAF